MTFMMNIDLNDELQTLDLICIVFHSSHNSTGVKITIGPGATKKYFLLHTANNPEFDIRFRREAIRMSCLCHAAPLLALESCREPEVFRLYLFVNRDNLT